MHYSIYRESEDRKNNNRSETYFDKKHSQLKDLDNTIINTTYFNRNNNRVCSEEIQNLSKNIVENRSTTERQESSCKIFFGLINQLRHKRKTRLKSVSYHTENDSISKTRFKTDLRDFGSYSNIPISSQITEDFCKKEVVFDSNLKKMVEMKSDETSKNIYSYYSSIRSLIRNNQKVNSERTKKNKIKAKLLKELVDSQPLTNQKYYSLKTSNLENRIIREKVYFRKKKTRSTQTKIHPYHIHLMKYYINTIADFIVFRIVEEYQMLLTISFFEDFIKSNGDVLKSLQKKVFKYENRETPYLTFSKVKKAITTPQKMNLIKDSLTTLDVGKGTGFDCLENFDTMEDISNNPSQSVFSNYELYDYKTMEQLLKKDRLTQSKDIKYVTNSTGQIFENGLVPPQKDTPKTTNVKHEICHKFIVFDESSFLEKIDACFSKIQIKPSSVIHYKNTKLVATQFELFLNNGVYTFHFATKILTKTPKMKVEEKKNKCTPSKRIYIDTAKSGKELKGICKFEVESQILINLEEHVKILYLEDSVAGLLYDLLDIQESEMGKHIHESYQEHVQLSENLYQRSLKVDELKGCKYIPKTKCVPSSNKADDRHLLDMQDKMILKMSNSESCWNILTENLDKNSLITILQKSAKWSWHRKSETFSKFHLTMECSLVHFEKSEKCSFRKNTYLEENNLTSLFIVPDCFPTQTGLVGNLRTTDVSICNCMDPQLPVLVSDRDPFPIRCGIRSVYRFVFQSWIFQ